MFSIHKNEYITSYLSNICINLYSAEKTPTSSDQKAEKQKDVKTNEEVKGESKLEKNEHIRCILWTISGKKKVVVLA